MGTVNVNRNLTDQFYRYKMPKLLAKVEGKGNGIKTVIVNMVDIAKALNRPPMYPTKYFGCVLGAQVNCDLKNERYIVNGAHESSKLQDILDGFIQKYVLCASCSNPETVLACLPKRGIITTSCKACGYNGTISNKDKLTTYILKCPPNQSQVVTHSSQKKEKGGKKGKKEGKVQNGDSGDGVAHDDSDEMNNGAGGEAYVDEDDWGDDTTDAAVARRMDELSAGAKGLMLNDDLSKSSEDRLEILFEFVKKRKTSDVPFEVQVQKDIVAEAERLDIRDKAVIALCELLFDEKMVQQIKIHRLLFLRFTADNRKAQKYLLRGFELTVKLYKQTLMTRVPHILKAFYDNDILDEKILLDWGSKVYKKTVGKEMAEEIHEKAGPFLKWLKEAEEEDSDDEEEDEEEMVDVEFDDRVRGNEIQAIKESSSPQEKSKKNESVDEGEIDIDAI